MEEGFIREEGERKTQQKKEREGEVKDIVPDKSALPPFISERGEKGGQCQILDLWAFELKRKHGGFKLAGHQKKRRRENAPTRAGVSVEKGPQSRALTVKSIARQQRRKKYNEENRKPLRARLPYSEGEGATFISPGQTRGR